MNNSESPANQTESANQKRPRFSLVVPAYNEEVLLPRLLDTVDVARSRYHGGADAIEVIVGDNVSTDRTADLARERGCRVARVEKRAIGAVRNGGAKIAQGSILCFIDADMQLHPEIFNAVDKVLDNRRYIAGTSGMTLERVSFTISLIYVSLLPLKWMTGMDAGLVFCRREDFDTIGGYREDMLFKEDVEFLMELYRLGKRRGQKLGRTKRAESVFSTRKWDEMGEFKILCMLVRGTFAQFFSKNAVNRLARQFWYEVRQTPGH